MNLPMNQEPNRDAEQPMTMSLLGGVGRQDNLDGIEDLDGPPAGGMRQMLGQGTLLVIIVVLIAAGSLYAMRISQGELTSSAANREVEAKIEQALIRVTAPGALDANSVLNAERREQMFKEAEPFIAMLSSDFREHQVPPQYVKKNPFVLPQRKAEVAVVDTSAADARLRQLQIERDRLKLKSVVSGRVPVAMINDDFVRQGQQIGSFIIKSIDTQSLTVTIVSGTESFVLTMQD